jgi:hypothetical protein
MSKLQGKCFKQLRVDHEAFYLVCNADDHRHIAILEIVFSPIGTRVSRFALSEREISRRDWDRIYTKTFAKAWERYCEEVDQLDLGIRTNVEGFEWPL